MAQSPCPGYQLEKTRIYPNRDYSRYFEHARRPVDDHWPPSWPFVIWLRWGVFPLLVSLVPQYNGICEAGSAAMKTRSDLS
jgi:hypothetical protein